MESGNSLGIVIPAYREEENISKLCLAILDLVPNATIIVVDDSPDELTSNAIKSLEIERIQVHHRKAKQGRGSAVLYGMKHLERFNFDFILEMDADFSHNPNEIIGMMEYAIAKNYDLIIGSRYSNGSKIIAWPVSRRFLSKLANTLARVSLRVPVSDYTNGFRLYSKSASIYVTANCGKFGDGFIALSEILVNLHFKGFKIAELPSIFQNRIRGKSSLSFREISSAFVGLGKIYLYKRTLL